jgi:hypothetical protein
MADIGAMLREARMREHLDIAEFESRTKIRAKYLRALEDEEWGLLPGYTYAKSFLRTYADMLGLDGRMLVDEFKRQYQDPSETELAPPPAARGGDRRARERGQEHGRERSRERSGSRAAGPSSRVLAVAVLVVLLAAALFVVHELRKKSTPPVAHTTTTTTRTTTTKTRTRTATRPKVQRVALALVPLAPVHVCLIGYRSRHGGADQRVNAVLDPGAGGPVHHADDHFLVSFSGGAVRMLIDGHSLLVAASTTTVAYEVFLSGHHLPLAPTAAPSCK